MNVILYKYLKTASHFKYFEMIVKCYENEKFSWIQNVVSRTVVILKWNYIV